MNSFTSNSKNKITSNPSADIRPLLMAVLLLALSQFMFIQFSSVIQEGSKQIVQYKREWVREKNVVPKNKDRDTVFFFGSSKVAAGVLPNLFDRLNQNKTNSYNLALPALPLGPHYYMLRNFLKNNEAPKYIILALESVGLYGGLFTSYAPHGAGFFEVMDYSLRLKNGDILLNYLFPSRLNWREISAYLLGKLFHLLPDRMRSWKKEFVFKYLRNIESFPHDWNYAYESFFVTPEKNMKERREFIKQQKGYYYFPEQSVVGGKLPVGFTLTDQHESSEMADPYLDVFFKLCTDYNIKIILITPYLLDQPGEEQAQALPESWSYLRKVYNDVLFVENGFQTRLYPPHFFSDPAHANQDGADTFTREIYREFNLIHNRAKGTIT
jgi:hypothetical protein